jgi:hypothetical protein
VKKSQMSAAASNLPGFRTRIDLMLIRIRIEVSSVNMIVTLFFKNINFLFMCKDVKKDI